ncbi:hypothetical protein [Ureibacillus sinduriensis]|uniref:Nudix hydrolase domain-containing protein n=1 Tax=Ureibacillus sinduriensis BLB-1 = JCM 15800 TaxID=1384057 RepID=A0A0A3HU12_9BACL|nr:hypothetical protein [Ureibacillus sinduriensis]KGR74710.1 hypothetical protein CD33_16650 [Ureibacillus sinduriensis BLB-1 = JCM 15800]
MTNKKWEETILVAPRNTLFNNESLAFQGTEQRKEVVDEIIANLSKSYISFRRGATTDPTPKENNAEINTDYKQPIPYVLIKRGNEIYTYERLSGGGEARLHSKLSLGVGGHMNPEEGIFQEVLMTNLTRELEEELSIQSSARNLRFIGLINDDLNEVGKVHLGILAILELSDDATVNVREVEQLKGYWLTIDELKQSSTYDRLEPWSQIAVDIL